ncbi:hypothetical protein KM043_000953 [Ampulex compressa]|nr:hypothetical protein KM043_000953 [Ampulex compressa]
MTRTSTISVLVEVVFRAIGVWPNLSHPGVYWMICLVPTLGLQYFQYSYAFEHLDNLANLVDCLCVALSYSLANVKLINLWSKRRLLFDIVAIVEEDWRECEEDGSSVSDILKRNALLARIWSNALIFFYPSGAILYILIGYIMRPSLDEDGEQESCELPMKTELPFSVCDSPLFEIVALTQLAHQVWIAIIFATSTSFLLNAVFHVSSQIDVMHRNLLEVCSMKCDSDHRLRLVGGLVDQHRRIIAFSNDVDDLFSYISLMQLLLNTLVICCLTFMIVYTIGTDQAFGMIVKYVLFYIGISTEAFVFGYAGDYLSSKSTSIANMIYESLWYDLPTNQSRILLLMMLRSQKRLTITAGKVADMSLEGFAAIMKTSASYASVLYTLY